jgi:hypothetical protein
MSRSTAFNADFESAHKRSIHHRDEVLASDLCGCFHCGETFPPSEIVEWVDKREGIGTTALCPRCAIDAVIGARSGLALSREFLQGMHDYWFGSDDDA